MAEIGIVAFVSSKGGVGKTTSCVSLAAALAQRGRRVLLVDLDPQVSASLSLGLERSQLAPSVADVLLRDRPAREAVHRTRVGGLDLLPSSADMVSAEPELPLRPRAEMLLAHALAGVEGEYDAILVDCPPGLGILSRNALAAARGYVVPVVPHFLAMEGVESLTRAVDRLAFRTQRRTRLIGLLPTMVDYRTSLARDAVGSLRQRFGSDVFAVEIRVNVRLAEAPARGLTIFQYDADSVGARSYALAAEELLLRGVPRGEAPPVGGEPQPAAAGSGHRG